MSLENLKGVIGVELFKKLFVLALGIIIIALVVPFALFIAGGAIVFAIGIVGLVLGAIFLGMLGLSAIFLLPLLLLLGIILGFITHPLAEIILVAMVLYVLYRWWQRQRTRAAF